MSYQLTRLLEAYAALYGPPPTPEQLAHARSLIAAQKARDTQEPDLLTEAKCGDS